VIAFQLQLFSLATINVAVFLYGFSVPLFILCQNLLIDLNNKRVFAVWVIIGLVFLAVFLLTKNNPELNIRHPNFKAQGKLDKLIAAESTSALKSLAFFLLAYGIINPLLKKNARNYIVNTFRQHKWYNDAAERKLTWLDVLINFLLFAVIIVGVFIRI
jgi:hypothetical protein